MHPIICKLGPLTVYSYGLMLAIAFIVCSTLITAQAKKQDIPAEIAFNLAFLIFISGIIGARIFYIAMNMGYYIKNPLEIIMLQQGGLAWFGGLIFGVFSGLYYLKAKKLPVYKILDLFAPFVALGQAIGRIGCLLNGCCFGKASQFGLYFQVYDAQLIPTQLYSSLALLLIFFILRYLQNRPHREGQIFFTYLLLYSTKRFFIEFWRADNPTIISGLTLFQILSIAVFCVAITKLALPKNRK